MRVYSFASRQRLWIVLVASLVWGLLVPSRAWAEPPVNVRAFMLTTSYGVMAGTLTGVATLAFTGSPSENLRNVAIGASLGLYTGIALGVYLVYVVGGKKSAPAPSTPKKEDEDEGGLFGLYPVVEPSLAQNDSGRYGLGFNFSF